ncbi:hypothetical protein [Neosynechococcus sphagnicola]|uniref:hypothetical protein n=1 Tax=Neosynechococcus sphagnicola TaxID=1501145 RepID=UPI00068F54EB|nr:hypothetical protein [Neosynechococcus sphagnicola]
MQLSPLTAYYLRRLLRQHLDRFQSIVAPGAAMTAHPLADLNQVLNSLYLDEFEIAHVVSQLEGLVRYHQVLIPQNSRYSQELARVEQQIFWLLGFKRSQLTNDYPVDPPPQGSLVSFPSVCNS